VYQILEKFPQRFEEFQLGGFSGPTNERDRQHGHRRVYNPDSFHAHFREAGFRLDFQGGYWLKPLANGQIEAAWNEAMIRAYMVLGEQYPEIAGEIYVIASAAIPIDQN
jgi:hypothetical protein